MFGPGTYRPDPTEGITAIADLPPPEIVPYSRTHKRQACPRCGYQAYRDKEFHRTLHDLGNLDVWCPRDLVVTYSQHYCTKCRKYFRLNMDFRELITLPLVRMTQLAPSACAIWPNGRYWCHDIHTISHR